MTTYSNGRPSSTGRGFTTDGRSEAQVRADAEIRAEENRLPSEGEIRRFYERQVGSTTKQFGPTSFDVGKGLSDQRAFDYCVTEFGYRRTVLALAGVSQRAGQLRPHLRGAR